MMKAKLFVVALLISSASIAASAQEASPMAQPQQPPAASTENGNTVPVFRIQVVGRDIPAINYWHRSGATQDRKSVV